VLGADLGRRLGHKSFGHNARPCRQVFGAHAARLAPATDSRQMQRGPAPGWCGAA
jgi:hypothetical protein